MCVHPCARAWWQSRRIRVSTDEQTDGKGLRRDGADKTCTLGSPAASRKPEKPTSRSKTLPPSRIRPLPITSTGHRPWRAAGHRLRGQGDQVIVDEFTGRLMIGRCQTKGPHQAIEAKEGGRSPPRAKRWLLSPSRTTSRMYKKLSGMTGTAKIEAPPSSPEICCPEHRYGAHQPPLQRNDYPMPSTRRSNGKYNAVTQQEAGMPPEANAASVLVGTAAVEKSETLAKMLQ